ncbi:MAG: lipid-A-disaccharide synthase [Spirochaetes bacterium]|nr:lipid-A-disaccharide synthase [Spirochaetota bacterium]
MPRIFISTAEVSGDVQASRLLAELHRRHPGRYQADALGGEHLRRAGANILEDLSTQSSVGLLEGLPFLLRSVGQLRRFKRILEAGAYDLAIFVDGQGRNLPLGVTARKLGIKTVYYFPPPVSTWGAWNIPRMRPYDLLLCPFEADHLLYTKAGCASVYTGHPFCALPDSWDPRAQRRQLGLPEDGTLLAIFPGSRPQEIIELTQTFLEACRLLRDGRPDLHFVLSLAHGEYREQVCDQVAHSGLPVPVVERESDRILQASDLLLTASGTATLQAAFFHVPMAIAYRVSFLTEWLARRLLKVRHIGLPNILAARTVCPEFINRDLSAPKLAAWLSKMVDDAPARRAVSDELAALRRAIAVPDPYGRMVDGIEAVLAGKAAASRLGA